MDKLPPSLSVLYTFHYLMYIASSLILILFDTVCPSPPVFPGFAYPVLMLPMLLLVN